MQPTRRRCLAITAAGIGAGVAGCLSSGSNVNYPEPEDSGGSSDSGNSSDPDGSDEPEEPSVEIINERLAEETDTIYDELRWFETEYEATMRKYKSRLRSVYNELQSLLSTLDSDGRIEADQLASVETLAREVAGSVNSIPDAHFSNHADFQAVNNEKFPVVERFRQREDWSRVEEELTYLSRIYGGASTDESIQERYSPNPIDNRLYDWLSGGRSGKLFEVRHISDDSTAHEDAEQRLPGHGVYVVGDSTRDIEDLDRPLGGPRWELLSELENQYDPFAEPANRRYRLFARIHAIDGSGDIDPNREIAPDGEPLPVLLYGQRYESPEAAAAAFDAVMTDKDIEDTIQWGQETWNRVLYDNDGDRFYAHFLRAGSFIVAVNPTTTPWEERDDNWTQPLSGTWVNP